MARRDVPPYPLCDEDDCYCRRHWPDRSGGEEEQVVNNDDHGWKVWRCQVALNQGDYDSCHICDRWMMGSCLSFDDADMKICVRCFKNNFHQFIESRLKEDPCFLVKLFNDPLFYGDCPTVECESCSMKHTLFTTGDDDFPILYKDIKGVVEWIDLNQQTLLSLSKLVNEGKNEKLKEILKEDWVDFKRTCKAKRQEDKKNQRKAIREQSKRVIREYLPDATEDDAATLIKRKTDKNDPPPTTKDVLAFIEWLNN